MKKIVKKLTACVLLAALFTALFPADRVQAEEAQEAQVIQQKGKYMGKTTNAPMQPYKGNKIVQWRWECTGAQKDLSGYRTLWDKGKPKRKTVYIDNKVDAVSAAGGWEADNGTLYVLCHTKKENVLAYIVAKKNGKILRKKKITIKGPFEREGRKNATHMVLNETIRMDKKGSLVAFYYTSGEWENPDTQRGLLSINTKTGKYTYKKLEEFESMEQEWKEWCMGEDGSAVALPVTEGSQEMESVYKGYAYHKKTLYRIDQEGDIYKGVKLDGSDLQRISTGGIYTVGGKYSVCGSSVSGNGKVLYVRYWKGWEDSYSNEDRVFYMVCYDLT